MIGDELELDTVKFLSKIILTDLSLGFSFWIYTVYIQTGAFCSINSELTQPVKKSFEKEFQFSALELR